LAEGEKKLAHVGRGASTEHLGLTRATERRKGSSQGLEKKKVCRGGQSASQYSEGPRSLAGRGREEKKEKNPEKIKKKRKSEHTVETKKREPAIAARAPQTRGKRRETGKGVPDKTDKKCKERRSETNQIPIRGGGGRERNKERERKGTWLCFGWCCWRRRKT